MPGQHRYGRVAGLFALQVRARAFHPVAEWMAAEIARCGDAPARDGPADLPGASPEISSLLASILGGDGLPDRDRSRGGGGYGSSGRDQSTRSWKVLAPRRASRGPSPRGSWCWKTRTGGGGGGGGGAGGGGGGGGGPIPRTLDVIDPARGTQCVTGRILVVVATRPDAPRLAPVPRTARDRSAAPLTADGDAANWSRRKSLSGRSARTPAA